MKDNIWILCQRFLVSSMILWNTNFSSQYVFYYIDLVLLCSVINIIEWISTSMKNISKTKVKVHIKLMPFYVYHLIISFTVDSMHAIYFYSWNSVHFIAAAEIVSHSGSAINNRWQTRSKSVHAIYFFLV